MIHLSLKACLYVYFISVLHKDVLLKAKLLALSFATSIEDAITYPNYYYFTFNQTGNTVLLAVSISSISSNVVTLPNISTSLSVFILSS